MEGESKELDVEKGEKKHKKRQKKILADLKQQIEFYFSGPNLQKDRFLRQRIMEHPQGCVEIATIASFNRMKKLCGDITLVVKAMKMCPSVEVIDDCLVKPSKALTAESENVDAVTVYVEKLPPNADHDWVKSMFSSCGKVVYVSLPRYKFTRDIKGFAFVEFEHESEVKKALEMFRQEKKTVKKDDENGRKQEVEEPVEKQGKKNKKRKQKLSESEHEDGKGKKLKGRKGKQKKGEEKIDSITDSSVNTSTHKKRKRNIDNEASDENETSIKVKKNGGIKKELSESDSDSVSARVKRKRENNDNDVIDFATYKKAKNISESDDKDLPDDNDGDKKHKKRKRKKKENKEIDIPNLKVISKIEWLRLKQEYQKLQRQAVTEMKMNLKKNQEEEHEDVLEENEIKQKPWFPKEGAKIETTKKEKSEGLAKLEMQPGVVLKYSTNEITEKQNLRDVFSSIAPVSYLEKQEDDKMGFVRFQTREGCQKVVEAVKSGSLENIKVKELTEKEDSEYWEKLNKERLERLQQNKGRIKQRGSQKIADKIEAQAKKRDHIHFDE